MSIVTMLSGRMWKAQCTSEACLNKSSTRAGIKAQRMRRQKRKLGGTGEQKAERWQGDAVWVMYYRGCRHVADLPLEVCKLDALSQQSIDGKKACKASALKRTWLEKGCQRRELGAWDD